MKSRAICLPFDKPDVVILSHERSGTHFLEASLGSHPKINKRSECVLRRLEFEAAPTTRYWRWHGHVFFNRADRVNTAIVMYSQVKKFAALCGPLRDVKIIHLLRNPADVARSFLQRAANKTRYGDNFQAHFRIGRESPPNAPIATKKLPPLRRKIAAAQKRYGKLLDGHSDLLTLRYEDITKNRQVNRLPEEFSRTILAFLGLPYRRLTNDLRKTG